jgi:hypothetical protein
MSVLKTRRKRRYVNRGAKPPEFWSPQLVLESVRALHRNGILPNLKTVRGNNDNPKFLRILEHVVGVRTTPNGLVGAGIKHFGRWDLVITAAGLDRRRVRADIIWHEELIIAAIHALKKENVSLAYVHVQRNRSRKMKDILRRSVGFKTTGARLLGKCTVMFGNWGNALKKAGVDPAQVGLRYWSKETTLKAIQGLESKGLSLNGSAITHSRSQVLSSTLHRITGRKANGHSLYSAAIKNFGSWRAALSAAGIDAKAHNRSQVWSCDLIIKVIKAYKKAEIPLSCSALEVERSRNARNILKALTGRNSMPVAVYSAGGRYFGSWPKALKAAGIDPPRIEVNRYSSLADVPHQREWTLQTDGKWRNIAFYGPPPKQADALLEERELQRSHGFGSNASLAIIVAKSTNGRISVARAEAIIIKLKEALTTPDFR